MYTKRISFPKDLPPEKTSFCILCGAPSVAKAVQENGTSVFKCSVCNGTNDRFLAWDPGMEQFFNENDELVHSSVGVIVQNPSKEILLFKRVKYPFLWTIPAGHLDKGEGAKEAAFRELYEETHIKVNKLQLVFEGEIRGDSCVGGADIHLWHAYVCQVEDDVEPIIEAEEGREWCWFALNELPELTMPVDHLLSLSEVCSILE